MAKLFDDGFGQYGSSANLDLRWTRGGTCTWGSTSGVDSYGGVAISTSSSLTHTFPTAATLSSGGTFHIAYWFKCTNMPGDFANIFQFNENNGGGDGNSPQIQLDSNGALRATQCNNAGVTLATSSNGVIVLNQEHHIEISGKYASSGGFVKVWVDRTLVINFSGDAAFSSDPTSWTGIRFECDSSTAQTISHVVAWDEVGSNFVHTQLASSYEHIVEELSPDADDGSPQFTPSAGSNYQNVDDSGFHDGDSTYNESSTVGHVDQHTNANQAALPAVTFAITQHLVARKTTAGGANLRGRIISGGSTRESADFALTTSYAHYADYSASGTDPSTSSAWATNAVDSVKTGYEFQS